MEDERVYYISNSNTSMPAFFSLSYMDNVKVYLRKARTGMGNKCPICDGTGYVIDYVPFGEDERGVEYGEVDVQCSKCQGTGTIKEASDGK